MRHSLFFGTGDEAEKAEAQVNLIVADLIDCYQTNDGESRNVEVRFVTSGPLPDFDQRYLIRKTRPITYATLLRGLIDHYVARRPAIRPGTTGLVREREEMFLCQPERLNGTSETASRLPISRWSLI